MKRATVLIISAALFVPVLPATQSTGVTPVGTAFTYQGRLIDSNRPADGQYDLQFKLYDAVAGGLQTGADVNRGEVNVIDGYFTVELDFGNVFGGSASWLAVAVRPGDQNDPNEYTVLAPRQRITPVPYAIAGADGNDTSVGGSVFTHWGDANAPSGSSRIYYGFGYAGYLEQAGGGEAIVVQTGDPGGTMAVDGAMFYPLHTCATTYLPTGITAARYIKAAVCYADAPTTVIWGTHTAPVGWSILYKGYVLSSHYTKNAPRATICVECENFDANDSSGGSNYAMLYGAKVKATTPSDSALLEKFIKCAVIKKN